MTNILVIDDDAAAQERLRQLTGGPRDLQFIPASTGPEGLSLALEREPDLVILNAQLRDAAWSDVLRTLHKELRKTAIILTTSSESTEQAVQAFRAGACDYVSKPIKPSEMATTIERACHLITLREERDSLAQQLTETTETLWHQQKELNAVHIIGRLTTSLLDLDILLDRLTEIALHLTDAQESLLFLRDEDQDELYLRAGKNLSENIAEGFKIPVDGAAAGRAMRSMRPVLVTGEEARSAPGGPSEALLHMPIQTPGRVIGLLTLSSQRSDEVFSERTILLLSTLVDYAAIAIQNARLFEGIAQSKSLTDSVFSSIASGVVTLDRDGRISLINRSAREILQMPDAAAGASLADACPAVKSRLQSLIETTIEVGEPAGPLEIDIPLPSGDVAHLRMTLSPLTPVTQSTEGVTVVFEDITRQRKLESRFRLFQRYLSPTVIERLPDDPQELRLGGVRREIACLFADLRGFVDFSVRHPPETLMETLNEYLGLGAEAVMDEEGTLDKFQGDAVVAFFNAPLSQDDYVLRAVRAANRIREATTELHARLGPEHRLEYGMGISVGEAIVGNIGTPQRLDYTAIGPSVNMAKRLQTAAEPGQILVTPPVYQCVRDHVTARPIILQSVTGPGGPVRAYELLNAS